MRINFEASCLLVFEPSCRSVNFVSDRDRIIFLALNDETLTQAISNVLVLVFIQHLAERNIIFDRLRRRSFGSCKFFLLFAGIGYSSENKSFQFVLRAKISAPLFSIIDLVIEVQHG